MYVKRIKDYIKHITSSLENFSKFICLALIPFMVFFLVLSDRNPFNYANIAVFGLEGIFIIILVIKRKFFVIDYFIVLLLLFLVLIGVSQVANLKITGYPLTLVLLCLYAFFFYQLMICLNNKEKEAVFKLILLGGVMFVGFFIIYYRREFIQFDFSKRIGRELSDQNDLAKNLGIFCIISLIFVVKAKTFRKFVYALFYLISLLCVLFTGSISNLITILALSITILFFMIKGRNKVFLFFGLIILAAGIYGALQLPVMNYFRTRFTDMFNSFFSSSDNGDNSLNDRFFLALEGLDLFTSKPIFGYGYDQVRNFTHGRGQFSHNNFAELLASFGLFGFLSFEALLVYPIVKELKKKEKDEFALFTLLYLFIFQIFLIIYRKKIEYLLIPIGFSYFQEKRLKSLTISFNKMRVESFTDNYYVDEEGNHKKKPQIRMHRIEL